MEHAVSHPAAAKTFNVWPHLVKTESRSRAHLNSGAVRPEVGNRQARELGGVGREGQRAIIMEVRLLNMESIFLYLPPTPTVELKN